MNLRPTFILCLGLLIVSLANTRLAIATLGEKADSVAKDRKAFAARQSSTTTKTSYTMQEITSQDLTLREYLTPSGIVFALAWTGLTTPDLSSLLGAYNESYKKAKKAKESQPRVHGRRSSRVVGDEVVVETWGHMRSMKGRAYVPSLVPTGVNIDEIR